MLMIHTLKKWSRRQTGSRVSKTAGRTVSAKSITVDFSSFLLSQSCSFRIFFLKWSLSSGIESYLSLEALGWMARGLLSHRGLVSGQKWNSYILVLSCSTSTTSQCPNEDGTVEGAAEHPLAYSDGKCGSDSASNFKHTDLKNHGLALTRFL